MLRPLDAAEVVHIVAAVEEHVPAAERIVHAAAGVHSLAAGDRGYFQLRVVMVIIRLSPFFGVRIIRLIAAEHNVIVGT